MFKNKFHTTLIIVFVFFMTLFVSKALIDMSKIAFNEFDEAHRAENAKEMQRYSSYLIPLTGSPQDRSGNLRVPYEKNPHLFVYYHLERPFLVYDLMILSTSLFGQSELSYRLPSFIFGMLTIVVFILLLNRKKFLAFSVSLVSLICSWSLWLSSQYAQLDTGLTFFLFLSLVILIKFAEKRSEKWILFSGLSFGAAVLCKGQQAIIFIIPLLYLFIARKIKPIDLTKFCLSAGIIVLPWVGYVSKEFGFLNFVKIFFGFAFNSASVPFSFNQAPIYWYVRWWWENLRPGWTLFLSLLALDLFKKNLDWKKKTILVYILGSLLAISVPSNKLWWYALPLVPAIAWYIYLSAASYLEKTPKRLINLSIVLVFASLPLFVATTNLISLSYGIVITVISWFILKSNLSTINKEFFKLKMSQLVFILSIILSLSFFWLRFPVIVPYDLGIKPVSEYFATFPQPKCLFISDLPVESVLFYGDAGEVRLLTEGTILDPSCKNYLVTPNEMPNQKLLKKDGNIKLYQLEGSLK